MVFKSISKLVSGTLVAQILPFLVLPFLTYSMSGESFGLFSIFFTTTVMLGSLITLRFEYAINSAKNLFHAKYLFLLCFFISFIFSIITLLLVVFLVYLGIISLYWILLPFTAFFFSLTQSCYAYVNLHGDYNVMSISRVIIQLSCATIQILITYIYGFDVGAYLGLMIGYLIGCIYFLYIIKSEVIFFKLKLRVLILVFAKYANYPRLVFPGTFVNFLSGNLPLYAITFFFGNTQAGYYSLAIRIAGAPTGIIGRSIGDVFRRKAKIELSRYGVFSLTFNVFCKYVCISAILLFLLVYLCIDWFMGMAFSHEFKTVSNYLKVMIPMFFLQYISSSVSYAMMLGNKQFEEFKWQLYRLLLVMLPIGLLFFMDLSIDLFLKASTFAFSFSFLMYIRLCYKASKNHKGS